MKKKKKVIEFAQVTGAKSLRVSCAMVIGRGAKLQITVEET